MGSFDSNDGWEEGERTYFGDIFRNRTQSDNPEGDITDLDTATQLVHPEGDITDLDTATQPVHPEGDTTLILSLDNVLDEGDRVEEDGETLILDPETLRGYLAIQVDSTMTPIPDEGEITLFGTLTQPVHPEEDTTDLGQDLNNTVQAESLPNPATQGRYYIVIDEDEFGNKVAQKIYRRDLMLFKLKHECGDDESFDPNNKEDITKRAIIFLKGNPPNKRMGLILNFVYDGLLPNEFLDRVLKNVWNRNNNRSSSNPDVELEDLVKIEDENGEMLTTKPIVARTSQDNGIYTLPESDENQDFEPTAQYGGPRNPETVIVDLGISEMVNLIQEMSDKDYSLLLRIITEIDGMEERMLHQIKHNPSLLRVYLGQYNFDNKGVPEVILRAGITNPTNRNSYRGTIEKRRAEDAWRPPTKTRDSEVKVIDAAPKVDSTPRIVAAPKVVVAKGRLMTLVNNLKALFGAK